MKKSAIGLTLSLFVFVFFIAVANSVSAQFKEKTPAVDTMSVLFLKSYAASELKKMDEMTGGLKIIEKLLGNSLSNTRKALDRWDNEKTPDHESLFLRGILEKFEGNYNKSDSLFSKIKNDPVQYSFFGFDNIWMQLGDIYLILNKYDAAIDAFKQGALFNIEDTWPLISISLTYLEMNKFEEASEAFYAGLNDIRKENKINSLFIDAKDIALKEEKAKWDSLSNNKDKLEFLKYFWKRRDPNPTNIVNERLIEHYRRLRIARYKYSKAASPFYDDRGMVYIRWGKPDVQYVGQPRQSIKENETWVYDKIQSGLTLDFVNTGFGFELRSLQDAVQNTASLQDVIDMYEERSMYHASYMTIAQKIRTQRDVEKIRTKEEIQNTNSKSQLMVSLFESLLRNNMAAKFQQVNEYRMDDLGIFSFQGGQFFEFDAGAPHLPINFNVASFRSSQTISRVEFYYTIPFNQMVFIPSISHPDKHNTNLNLILKIYDQKYNEIKSIDRMYTINATTTEKESHFFLDQLVIDSMKSGKYNFALDIRNNEKDKVGIYQFMIAVRDYSSDTLTVSNIEIAQYVETTLSKDRYLKPKSNLRVVPNPAAGIVKTKPLWIYYEIYNLTLNNEGKSSYQVSYSIKMSELDQSFLSSVAGLFSSKQDAGTSSITTKEGKSINEKEYIAFDISELPKGIATLEVKIKDLLSGKESVSAINLTLIEEEKKNLNEKK